MWGQLIFAFVVFVGLILFLIAAIGVTREVGNAFGAFVDVVLDEADRRRPRQFKVKRRGAIAFPFNCPGCGTLFTHIVCGKCGTQYGEFGNCPHCRQRVEAISCPSCKALIER